MKQFLYIGLLVSTSLLLGSCEKFLDVNDNPNSPISETLPLRAKLPAALVSTVNQESLQLNRIGAFWGGYWGTTNEGISLFVDLKTYNGPALRHQRDGIPVWENGFNNLLYYQLMIEQAETEEAWTYRGIARIMQGWHFLRLVDIYNNIPFDDALKGTANATPAYEEGSEVYRKSIELISSGIEDLKKPIGGVEPAADDIMFKGNKSKWIRFANTIKLRALLRQSEVASESYIRAEIAEIVSEGSGFLGASEDALVDPGYLNTAGKLNPFWENHYRNVQNVATANYQDIRPTRFVLDQYRMRNDPRLNAIYVQVNGDYAGVLFGNPNVETAYGRAQTSAFKGPNENGGAPAGLFKSQAQPSVLMLCSESLFLQAEASARGWLSNVDASAAYDAAIAQSFRYLGVAANEVSSYLAQASVDLDQASDKIQRIIEQKWLALNSISSIEGWNDFRRLGIPAIPNSMEAPGPNVYPLRLMYPETERMTNNHNTSLQGNDDIITSRVWWDK